MDSKRWEAEAACRFDNVDIGAYDRRPALVNFVRNAFDGTSDYRFGGSLFVDLAWPSPRFVRAQPSNVELVYERLRRRLRNPSGALLLEMNEEKWA